MENLCNQVEERGSICVTSDGVNVVTVNHETTIRHLCGHAHDDNGIPSFELIWSLEAVDLVAPTLEEMTTTSSPSSLRPIQTVHMDIMCWQLCEQ